MFKLNQVVAKDIFSIPELTIDSDIVAIVGKSGSGKSTLLRLLNQLDDPTEGDIKWNDKSLHTYEPTELRKKVVMIPQNPVIFEGSVRDNLVTAFSYRDDPTPGDDQLKEVLDSLSLDKQLTDDAHSLSGGEKQRLALGRALLLKSADVLLLDEPASSLDSDTAHHVVNTLIDSARRHNQQVIMVSHDTDLAMSISDNQIQIDDYKETTEVTQHG